MIFGPSFAYLPERFVMSSSFTTWKSRNINDGAEEIVRDGNEIQGRSLSNDVILAIGGTGLPVSSSVQKLSNAVLFGLKRCKYSSS
jgi:hypothetical protein